MRKYLFIFLFLALLSLPMSCSHSPIPNSKNYLKSEQNLVQSGHHWEIIAEENANKILAVISNADEIYLEYQKNASPFQKAYHELLTSKLVSKGAMVVSEPTNYSSVFSYKTQVIRHNTQGIATHDLLDFGDLFLNREAPEQKTEVLITTFGIKNNRIIMSDSQIYYFYPINDMHYQKEIKMVRAFKVTDN